MKKLLLLVSILTITLNLVAQEELVYQKPPKEILDLADFERAPTLLMDSKRTKMIFQYRNTYKTLADLSEKEMRLAGLRINSVTNISSTITYVNNLKYKLINEPDAKQVEGLPADAKISNVSWSPDETKIAFTNTTATGVELWYMEFATGKAVRLTDANLNANLGNPYTWFRDNGSFLVRVLPADKPALVDAKAAIPTGPTVSVSEKGAKAQNRTYQDLLQNATDEANFEALVTSELYKVDLSGNKTLWKGKDMYSGETFSPDGTYILINTIHRPYSYIVPINRFPVMTNIYDTEGKLVSKFNDSPLREVLPKGFMATSTGKRGISWRADKPSTLYWVEALDGGDPETKVDYRDELFELSAPFTAQPVSLAKTINRYGGIVWGNETIAILYDNWWNTRNVKTYLFNPSDPKQQPAILSDRNYQDVYSDPGSFDTKRNEYGRYVLNLDGNKAYLIGEGYTEKGQFPFVDELDLKTKLSKRLYQSNYTDKKLDIISIIDAKRGEYLVRMQSATEYPNYYILNTMKRIAPVAITHFDNPFKSIANVYKEVIKYKRPDGVELTGTLYLPAGYDMQKKEKLPLVMWAYPTEYKDKSSAGQNTTNPNEFVYPYYGSPIYWVMRGYAILDDAAFPIVGEGDAEPNDTFISQLVANAKAAIDAVDSMGYVDRTRVAVGGHSYGAFMTANLLTHSDLFAAGIARSGAYNRTLTPFGFQAEERNYWEAPDVYNAMSPFMHVDKMKTPMLLVHGGDDNNSGTHTMQSERYFNALKGFGAPVRLVILPKESHGYAAKESVLHLLWEQDQWLEKYVKNKK
ncbi:dipeptidyl aminopeptidase/acylaminoacyl peptidase [Dysgonomonas sp. PFB1-18]|uniref:S9 family peptidase n=1 Tax=unclassified Dysgonomonas TaxID=2630389 RepID=UPI0024771271|nr:MULTISPECIES: prolyl oligopeptidase family serine peptidase [unclassified Dysgonomonas]MDH6309160.1 dipeptidyl aminopeptidase/acylaminoacyl peptidase [Dysgonomonas sp. PF1-14]MDH6338960.1 dipeptidyl aminopeptidase/acylaminoacyl peptidase [Dysgonomonas sp. PF1-16]MDH6380409.1 dipeptidyl aminopeptidase/acylaminoacyl peptidase [Dysgonomonas sp. PFB1-18]MDH6397788.1 dipeptidyl aminopeptidase/acylaminoacyl peptidase [Dysgonomonas sp. PF1-23]